MTTPGCRTIPKWEEMLIQDYGWLLLIKGRPEIYRLTKFLRKRNLTPSHIGRPWKGTITLHFNNEERHGEIKLYENWKIIGKINDDAYPDYNLENDERLGKFVKDLSKYLDSGIKDIKNRKKLKEIIIYHCEKGIWEEDLARCFSEPLCVEDHRDLFDYHETPSREEILSYILRLSNGGTLARNIHTGWLAAQELTPNECKKIRNQNKYGMVSHRQKKIPEKEIEFSEEILVVNGKEFETTSEIQKHFKIPHRDFYKAFKNKGSLPFKIEKKIKLTKKTVKEHMISQRIILLPDRSELDEDNPKFYEKLEFLKMKGCHF